MSQVQEGPISQQNEKVTQQKKEDNAASEGLSFSPPPFQLAAAPVSPPNDNSGSGGGGLSGNTNAQTAKNEGGGNAIQRKAEAPPAFSMGSESSPVQMKRGSEPVQFKAGNELSDTVQKKSPEPLQMKGDSGMPEEVKGKMESSMGQDFSNVKIHENSSKAKDVGALAFAQGNDVHFAPGQFQPGSKSGQELIGHELAHVKQQREGRVKPTTSTGGMAVNDSPSLEKEADDMGRKAVQAKFEPTVQKKVDNSGSGGNAIQKKEDPNASGPQLDQLSNTDSLTADNDTEGKNNPVSG